MCQCLISLTIIFGYDDTFDDNIYNFIKLFVINNDNLNNNTGYTPLIASVILESSDYKVSKYLIKKGVDTSIRYYSKKVIDYAEDKNNKELLELLGQYV